MRKEGYCFAKQFLAGIGRSIHINGVQILKYKGETDYDIFPVETAIEKGMPLTEEGQIKLISSYKDLVERFRYVIVSRRVAPSEMTYRGQRRIYELIRASSAITHLGEIPSRRHPHYVEYDVVNKRLRLVGVNAGLPGRPHRGEWKNVIEQKKPINNYKPHDFKKYLGGARKILEDIRYERWMRKEKEAEPLFIKEIPILISEANEIVCMQNSRDPPVFGCVGSRGFGKTIGWHNIGDNLHWKQKNRLFILNDRQKQFLELGAPSEVEGFNRELQKINHYPLPLPIVYLHPSDYDVREVDFEKEGIGFKMSLPYKSVIQNFRYFFQGNRNIELGNSDRYFKKMLSKIAQCQNEDQVETILSDELKNKRIQRGTFDKIYTTMAELYRLNICDVNSGVPSKWEIKERGKSLGSFFPPSALMSCGLIPIVENGHIYNKYYYPQYMRWLIQDVYENLLEKRLPYKERTWIMIDEIGQIYKKGKKKTVAAEALIDVVAEGRKPNIGCGYTTQYYSRVDEEIRLNTTHLFAVNDNESKDLAEIGSAFSLRKDQREDIKKLKVFEMMAMTKHKFIVYDIMSGERYETDEPIKGRVIFPMSAHTPPPS